MRGARPLLTLSVLALLLTGCSTTDEPPIGSATDRATVAATDSATAPPTVSASPETPTASAVPDEPELDHDSPDSLHVLVNKLHPLDPADYAPQDLHGPDLPASKAGMELREEAAGAAEDLFAAAAADGVDLTLVSAYRSYGYQQSTYGGWVERYGQAEADRISARPGYSEHQTGLAMDVGAADGACTLEQCFGDTPEGAWVAEHAAEHGWIIRYPDGAEDVTGYSPEPWHLRYVGTEAAAGVVQPGGVLETAWGFAPAPDYGPDSAP
ncbi:D-alanyl-D-alanine carboxypeptidase [Citricoccus muralis]|uniref:D-alanyl-D-alanine carboxypeptidase n=1 Tax=Citricoccus muralis TaxID=169134 RepID=A0A3D9LF82_9MICC|nr:D-alanyl-D-alanine carboxypeptidase [Citricoccus muralis]